MKGLKLEGFLRGLDEPVIDSLLQTDFYKFTMGQYIHKYGKGVKVTFAFKNRSKTIRIADYVPIEALKEQFAHWRTLKITESDIAYFGGLNCSGRKMYTDSYLDSLRHINLPEPEIWINRETGEYEILFSGDWVDVSHAEIPCLKIVSELFYRYYIQSLGLTQIELERLRADGLCRATELFQTLKNSEAFWSCFASRRTFSTEWHRFLMEYAAEYFWDNKLLRGTSDVFLAKLLGIEAMGTIAHEPHMVEAALVGYDDRDAFIQSQQNLNTRWLDLYGRDLAIGLPDTWGSDFYYNEIVGNMPEFWENWKGIREDSGDPEEEYHKFSKHCIIHGIDPMERMIIPSDGLTGKQVAELQKVIQILRSYGIGTHFGNNLDPAIFPTLSIVSKVFEVDGRGAVKLSNNIAKAIYKNREDYEKVVKIVDYTNKYSEQPTV